MLKTVRWPRSEYTRLFLKRGAKVISLLIRGDIYLGHPDIPGHIPYLDYPAQRSATVSLDEYGLVSLGSLIKGGLKLGICYNLAVKVGHIFAGHHNLDILSLNSLTGDGLGKVYFYARLHDEAGGKHKEYQKLEHYINEGSDIYLLKPMF